LGSWIWEFSIEFGLTVGYYYSNGFPLEFEPEIPLNLPYARAQMCKAMIVFKGFWVETPDVNQFLLQMLKNAIKINGKRL